MTNPIELREHLAKRLKRDLAIRRAGDMPHVDPSLIDRTYMLADEEVEAILAALNPWHPIETASRDGRKLLMRDAETGAVHVCYPKRFPRPISHGDDMTASRAGDKWEYFRDDKYAPGHTWSMTPTHWMEIPDAPQ